MSTATTNSPADQRGILAKGGILVWVLTAIVLALLLGSLKVGGTHLVPMGVGRVFATFSDLFSQFLSFSIPLIIIGLVTPAIADLGRGAGKWLGITAAIAYGSTLFSGFLTYLVCASVFPRLLGSGSLSDVAEPGSALTSLFTVEMPAAVGVMTALLLSFVVGIGLAMVPRGVLRKGFIEFRAIITSLIEKIIIPLLPLHIFGIFLNLTYTGEAWAIMLTLVRVVVVVLLLEVVILGAQYLVAGAIGRRNPLKALVTMLPAYLTALGTSSSAATIPVTLAQTRRNGVSGAVASFTVPLCATIHLAGSTSKIFAFAFAIVLTQGITVSAAQWVGFIFMLGITMVAAPGVPGGAIMAATGLLSSMLGFDDAQVALMIATYIALDSFGTATNVTGDGAIAIVVDAMAGGSFHDDGDVENARELSFDGMKYLDRVSVEGVVSPEDLAASAAAAGPNAVS
ncbi:MULTISPECIES: dicarboxylate/amino acid:cation symporter [unclassified Actinomyces]|uniref:dicarboxylate/amino acid:cation symporter n=1 Tax=unclassified Actinomyces TaxID=2609248 RepID=UPI0020172E51|nr:MULTISPECIES: dicarboxylate/amino acid:cation symporter [unclassified Actinomyces]MCL3778095.1 dicarboxylate/amino acid:cation symporter [Actinomyces sp. AC-20-1]MCL3788726.1 dicarboxylate/amino acid:cation symporter [Actinomyces sp. 187325]MCL3791800.1 dicarboxylate/amino acid:cation symporter [Actinomyces sp. 186855]MCL3794356.1 dicarboxylate/amino acid:cation symporter [Actinomyces sp. 217892]